MYSNLLKHIQNLQTKKFLDTFLLINLSTKTPLIKSLSTQTHTKLQNYKENYIK